MFIRVILVVAEGEIGLNISEGASRSRILHIAQEREREREREIAPPYLKDE